MTPLALVALLVGCSNPSTPTPAAQPSAPPTAALEHPVCDAWMACLGETDPVTLALVIDVYGSDGTCWTDDSLELCEGACGQGLVDSRAGDAVAPACLTGATDEELLDLAPEVCDTLPFPFTYDEWTAVQRSCVAAAVLTCAADVADQVEACLYVPTPPPELQFTAGDWSMTVTSTDSSGCPTATFVGGEVFDVAMAGDGYSLDSVVIDVGGDLYPGPCNGTVDCLITSDGTTTWEGMWLIGSFPTVSTFEGSMWTGDYDWGMCQELMLTGSLIP